MNNDIERAYVLPKHHIHSQIEMEDKAGESRTQEWRAL